MLNKIANVLKTIFATGVLVTLFAGALSLIVYIVAIIIGGEIAPKICTFIYKEYFPWVIRITTICIIIGLISMYLSKEKALVISEKHREKKSLENKH